MTDILNQKNLSNQDKIKWEKNYQNTRFFLNGLMKWWLDSCMVI